jgi:hypothetical protein
LQSKKSDLIDSDYAHMRKVVGYAPSAPGATAFLTSANRHGAIR